MRLILTEFALVCLRAIMYTGLVEMCHYMKIIMTKILFTTLLPLFDVITESNCIPDFLFYLSDSIEYWFECNCQITNQIICLHV